jgi:protein-S-isoprenylcysteine O-methyltransferase Ste14
MDSDWIWQAVLLAIFFGNFAFEAYVGTSGHHDAGWFKFYQTWIFGRLWSGPAYALPLMSQPRLPTLSGRWWAGVIGEEHEILAGYAWAGDGLIDAVGWTLFTLAWVLWVWAFIPKHPWAMQPPDRICRAGAYRVVRHPVNLGWLLFVTGWYALWGGTYALMASPLMYAFFVLEAFWEEKYLLEKGANNEDYRAYRREVPMFVPDFTAK